jgi:hypothetical protein
MKNYGVRWANFFIKNRGQLFHSFFVSFALVILRAASKFQLPKVQAFKETGHAVRARLKKR